MRLCVLEDRGVDLLEPLTLTRPAFELWCGAASLLERQQRALGADEVAALVRPELAELCQLSHPGMAVNDAAWLKDEATVLVNARWLAPEQPIEDLETARVGLVDDQVAYVVLPAAGVPECSPETIDDWTEHWKQTLRQCPAGGAMIAYPWELVENNGRMLCHDAAWFARGIGGAPASSLAVVGPADQLLIHGSAAIEPFVVADTRNGPVLIDSGAVVQSFSRLEGPCYVGKESWVLGAKLRGGTIGPNCRIGGEVEASIIQGFSNKYHDGFLGHSYLGEWVNLGAGTQVSDLRNDYGPIRVFVGGERVATGLTKVGVFVGDHSKTGLGTLLNSGTVVGAFCNLLPSGSLLPPVVPSFSTVRHGQIQERTDLRQTFATAGSVMRRRGRELTGTHIDYLFDLYERTARHRHQVIRDSESRRLRRSV